MGIQLTPDYVDTSIVHQALADRGREDTDTEKSFNQFIDSGLLPELRKSMVMKPQSLTVKTNDGDVQVEFNFSGYSRDIGNVRDLGTIRGFDTLFFGLINRGVS